MKSLAALIIVFALVTVGAFAAALSEAEMKQKKADYAKQVRARQQPMVQELEGMLGNNAKVTLFSIDPQDNGWRADPDGTWCGRPLFRGHIVRASSPIIDHGEQRAIVLALTDGIRESYGSVASCFEPYFGLTLQKGDKKIDIVVCFMCLNAKVYGAYAESYFILSRSHSDVFIESAKRHKLSLPYEDLKSHANGVYIDPFSIRP